MASATGKVIQSLRESLTAENIIVQMFTTHLAITPAGGYRTFLERHARQARKHAWQINMRLADFGKQRSLMRSGLELAWSLAGQTIAIPTASLSRLHDVKGREKFGKNVRDEYAAVACALALYQTLAQTARAIDDEDTVTPAGAICRDHQSLLDKLQEIIDKLADAAVFPEFRGVRSYEFATAERARDGARRIPAPSRSEGEINEVLAATVDLPIPNYDSLTTVQIIERLPQLSQADLATIDGYERRHARRTTVLARSTTLRGPEPWTGYDQMNIEKIHSRLRAGDTAKAGRVLVYERLHQSRSTILKHAERACTRG